MKKVIVGSILFLGAVSAYAQNPPPFAAYKSDGSGGWTPLTTTSSSNPAPSNPPPSALYCFNAGLGQWVPADSSCLGGGGGSGTVTSVTFTGDGTVLSSTPSSAVTTSGTLPATLNTQAANSVFGNFTGSTAAPTFSATPTFAITNLTGTCTGCTANSATSATTATNLAGGALGSAPTQTAAGATGFLASPTTSGHTFVYAWQPSGSAIAPTALDLATYLASPAAIGGTAANAGTFTLGTITGNGGVSIAPLFMTGALNTSGTATTNFPNLFIQPTGTAPVNTWSTAGTYFGINCTAASGNAIDIHAVGGASTTFVVGCNGNAVVSNRLVAAQLASSTNVWNLAAAGVEIANTTPVIWSSGSVAGTGPYDIGMDRSAAGVLEVDNGTQGNANGSLKTAGIIAASYQQTAASSTAGTCAMSTSTSCTITIAHTYATPVCIATQQSATLTGASNGCTVSGTTVTVTAAVANSETWGAWVFGNPN